jgi:hypothetical protein
MSILEGNILYTQRMAWPQTLTALENWDPTLDNPCLWEYVTCDHENRVTDLYATSPLLFRKEICVLVVL